MPPSENETRARRARSWSTRLFWLWLALQGAFLVGVAITLISPGELLHFGRRDLLILLGAAFLAELVLTLPILVVAAAFDGRASRASARRGMQERT